MRIPLLAAPLALLTTLAVACGGATAADTSNTRDSGSDGFVGDDQACVDPVEGESCTSTSDACPQIGDACCIGYVWQCDGSTHKWVKEGLGCACVIQPDAGGDVSLDAPRRNNDGGPWSCGSGGSVTCAASQYCEDHPPGIVGPDGSTFPDSYQCSPLPSACPLNPTCACVRAAIGNTSSCMVTSCDEADGHVEVHCIGI